MNRSVIIVAGGVGARMGAPLPKQFLMLCGKPVLVHTVERFRSAVPQARIVVTLPGEHIRQWLEIAAACGLEGTHEVCEGGNTRGASVRNALAVLPATGMVAIHDGVRPLLSEDLILRAFEVAERHGSAVPAIEPADSYRIIKGEGNAVVDRHLLRAIQTPQVFRCGEIKDAYEKTGNSVFTDDASVADAAGFLVTLFEGERTNIKITGPEDMAVAEALLRLQAGMER